MSRVSSPLCGVAGALGDALQAPAGYLRPAHFTALTSSVLNAWRSWTRSSWPSVIPTMRAVG